MKLILLDDVTPARATVVRTIECEDPYARDASGNNILMKNMSLAGRELRLVPAGSEAPPVGCRIWRAAFAPFAGVLA